MSTTQLSLLPEDPPRWGGPAAVPADLIVTSGRTEYTVHCDGPGGCGQIHRHILPGIRTGPCGATYTIPGPDDQELTDAKEQTAP
jgi:hypothetical protein